MRENIGNVDEEFYLFYGHAPAVDGRLTQSCLSQWWQCNFTVNGIAYSSAEQYMMAGKARLFHDEYMLTRILAAYHPAEVKKLGRLVRNYNSEIWDHAKFEIVCSGNLQKFSQNPSLMNFLLSTGTATLVEASPYDKIWGIGMDINNPYCRNRSCWRGQNLLGYALMEVRKKLRAKSDMAQNNIGRVI